MAATVSDDSYGDYNPTAGIKLPDFDESGIAKRLTRRKREMERPDTPVNSDDLSSSDEGSTSGNEESDPPVLRKSHSVFLGLEMTPTLKRTKLLPRAAPAWDPLPSPWLSLNAGPYVDVYIDGAYTHSGSERSKAGIRI